MESISMMLFGVILIVLGICNFRGHIESIHWYNRMKVSKEDQPLYGKYIGAGTGVMGISLILTGALQYFSAREYHFYILLAGVVIGLIVMLYAQFKYNRGLF